MAKTKKAVAKRRGNGKAGSKSAKKYPDKSLHRPSTKKPVSRSDIFVAEYLIDLNGAAAAVRAGYSPQCARQTAYDLLNTPAIADKIADAMDARMKRVEVDQDYVVRRLVEMVEADPRELSRVVHRNCRHCWGKDNRYQFTNAELQLERGAYERKLIAERPELDRERYKLEELMEEFDTRGGAGFDPTAEPNPECEECGGAGVEEIVFGDARTLSKGARLLYAGAKRTEKGMEVKAHSQFEALKLLGQHNGMFAQRHKIGGDPENPLPQNCGFALIPVKRDPDSYEPVGDSLPSEE